MCVLFTQWAQAHEIHQTYVSEVTPNNEITSAKMEDVYNQWNTRGWSAKMPTIIAWNRLKT